MKRETAKKKKKNNKATSQTCRMHWECLWRWGGCTLRKSQIERHSHQRHNPLLSLVTLVERSSWAQKRVQGDEAARQQPHPSRRSTAFPEVHSSDRNKKKKDQETSNGKRTEGPLAFSKPIPSWRFNEVMFKQTWPMFLFSQRSTVMKLYFCFWRWAKEEKSETHTRTRCWRNHVGTYLIRQSELLARSDIRSLIEKFFLKKKYGNKQTPHHTRTNVFHAWERHFSSVDLCYTSRRKDVDEATQDLAISQHLIEISSHRLLEGLLQERSRLLLTLRKFSHPKKTREWKSQVKVLMSTGRCVSSFWNGPYMMH